MRRERELSGGSRGRHGQRGRSIQRARHSADRHMRNSRHSRLQQDDNNLRTNSATFLFSNFPIGLTSADLLKRFAPACTGLGRIVNIIIPNKLDKKGHRFGFLFVRECTNPPSVVSKLQEIQLEGQNILAALAKPKSNPAINPSHKQPVSTGQIPTAPPKPPSLRPTTSASTSLPPPPPPPIHPPPTPSSIRPKTFTQALLTGLQLSKPASLGLPTVAVRCRTARTVCSTTICSNGFWLPLPYRLSLRYGRGR